MERLFNKLKIIVRGEMNRAAKKIGKDQERPQALLDGVGPEPTMTFLRFFKPSFSFE